MENETKQCPKCKEIILKGAEKCKHCGTDLRKLSAKQFLVGLLTLVLLGWGISSLVKTKPTNTETSVSSTVESNSNGKDTADENRDQPTPTPTEAPMKVTAREIADDFDSNQVAAENKWSGKLVEFSAKISNITDSGVTFQDVSSKEFSFTQISCKVKDKNQLLPLKNGDRIAVKGTVGKQSLGVIDVDNCQVVK